MVTIKKLAEMFQSFAIRHLQVVDHGVGRIGDIDPDKIANYPYVYMEFPSAVYDAGGRGKTYTMDFLFYDLPTDKEDKERNQLELYHDMALVAEDLLADIEYGFEEFRGIESQPRDMYEITSATIDPLVQKTKNVLCGCVLRLSLRVPHEYDSCNAPLRP